MEKHLPFSGSAISASPSVSEFYIFQQRGETYNLIGATESVTKSSLSILFSFARGKDFKDPLPALRFRYLRSANSNRSNPRQNRKMRGNNTRQGRYFADYVATLPIEFLKFQL